MEAFFNCEQQLQFMRGRTSPIFRLAKASADLMQTYKTARSLEEQCRIHRIDQALRGLKFAQLKINEDLPTKGIGIRNIVIYNALRVTLYHMPKGQTMKLHDHPKMSVINFVAKGKMEAQLYTNIKENLYSKEVHVLEQNSLKFIDGMRTKQNNLHEFKAIEPTFFIDIIFPDYDEHRPCTHYQQLPQIPDGKDERRLKIVDNYQIDFFQM